MKLNIGTSLFGYSKAKVKRYIEDLKKDYEKELYKKQQRMLELSENNHKMNKRIEELEKQLVTYRQREAYISNAIVQAEQKAEAIVKEGHRRIKDEVYRLKAERDKWLERTKDTKKQLLDFEAKVCDMLEHYTSEINYLKSQEISEDWKENDATIDKILQKIDYDLKKKEEEVSAAS